MGRIVVSQFITVDGVVEAPGDEKDFDRGGWAFRFDRGDEGNQFKVEEVFAAEALLLGRVTYQGFAAAWPSVTDEVGFADKMNSMPKYVVSTTLDRGEWGNSTVIAGDVPAELARLRQDVAGDILVNGSVRLVHTLAEHDLVDEYRLMVFPVVLGAGRRLFGDLDATASLRLVQATPMGPDGVVTMVYQPAR
jgi:dihydrofolate reductase